MKMMKSICLALVTLCSAIFMCGCGDDLSTPEATTKAFLKAHSKKDWDKAASFVVKGDNKINRGFKQIKEMKAEKQDEIAKELGSWVVKDVKVNGDSAEVTTTPPDGKGWKTFELKKIDGKWFLTGSD